MSAALNLRARYGIFTARLHEAEAVTRELHRYSREIHQTGNLVLVWGRFELADILADEGEIGEALAVEREVLAYFRQYKPKLEDTAILLNRVARLEKLAADQNRRRAMTPS